MKVQRHDYNFDYVKYILVGAIGKQHVRAETEDFFWNEATGALYGDTMPHDLIRFVRRYPEGPDEGFKKATFTQRKKVERILAPAISRDMPEEYFLREEKAAYRSPGEFSPPKRRD